MSAGGPNAEGAMTTVADPDKMSPEEFARLMREATPENPVTLPGGGRWMGMARADDPIYTNAG